MTSIQVLLDNIRVAVLGASGTLLTVWAIYYFFRHALFGEGGRNPVKIAVSGLAITGAAAVFYMIPGLISAGGDTGEQITGVSYSMTTWDSATVATGVLIQRRSTA